MFYVQVACQDEAEEGDEDAEGTDNAEYDSVLMESAGDIIPSMAKAVGGDAFKPYFEVMLPDLLKRLVSPVDLHRSLLPNLLWHEPKK